MDFRTVENAMQHIARTHRERQHDDAFMLACGNVVKALLTLLSQMEPCEKCGWDLKTPPCECVGDLTLEEAESLSDFINQVKEVDSASAQHLLDSLPLKGVLLFPGKKPEEES